jgi:hypothetical protein
MNMRIAERASYEMRRKIVLTDPAEILFFRYILA